MKVGKAVISYSLTDEWSNILLNACPLQLKGKTLSQSGRMKAVC